jgi:endonuclease G, mitochondrial
MNKVFSGIISVFLLLACTNVSHAQWTDIEVLETRVQEHKQALDTIFKALEQAKLKKIQTTLKDLMPSLADTSELVAHQAMILSYNEFHEQADWLVHIVSKDILFGTVGRSNDFRPDPKVSTFTADSADYWNSGYDRGHLAPSADFRWSAAALSESYYYSNMSPQHPDLNRGAWSKLENQVREWAIDAGELCVVTGPILKPDLPKVPQGSHRVSIPEHYYKIVYDYSSTPQKAIGFIFPNTALPYRLEKHVVSIDSIERRTGIDFFHLLPDSLQAIIESSSDLSLWPVTQYAVSGEMMPIDYTKGQVSTLQARYFFGQQATVCGTVVATRYNQNGKSNPTYINLDKRFPEQVFTVVIFGKERMNFSYEPEVYLKDKRICVTGKVGEYNGVPQIIATEETQIEVMP